VSAFFFRTSDVDASTRRFRTDASAPFAPPADGRISSCAPGTGRRFRTIRSVQVSLRVAEVKKIQADKLAAEIQQKIEAIAASVSQRYANRAAASGLCWVDWTAALQFPAARPQPFGMQAFGVALCFSLRPHRNAQGAASARRQPEHARSPIGQTSGPWVTRASAELAL